MRRILIPNFVLTDSPSHYINSVSMLITKHKVSTLYANARVGSEVSPITLNKGAKHAQR
jgi:hypothetical protein